MGSGWMTVVLYPGLVTEKRGDWQVGFPGRRLTQRPMSRLPRLSCFGMPRREIRARIYGCIATARRLEAPDAIRVRLGCGQAVGICKRIPTISASEDSKSRDSTMVVWSILRVRVC